MNFKKGSTITKEKLTIENKKSFKIMKQLPSNLSSYAMIKDEVDRMIKKDSS